MTKRSKLLFIFFIVLLAHTRVHALIISEIMFDPEGSDTDREWVEVLNEGSDSVDLKNWKFSEGGTNHGLAFPKSITVLSPGEYAVIAQNPTKFINEYPAFSGTVIDSSFSLSNNGELIALKDGALSVKDSLTYAPSLGGSDDGTTLSFMNGAWVRGDPTPGSANVLSVKPVGVPPSTAPPITTPSIAPTSVSESALNVIMPQDKTVVAGADSEFAVRVTSLGKKVPENSLFTWSFGDGGTRSGRSVVYHYQYPGVYTLIVEAEADGMAATGRMKVRVIDSTVTIANVGNDTYGTYIELKNVSPYEVDLSGWKFGIDSALYQLPKNTFIAAKQTVKYAGSILGFASSTITATTSVRLIYPNQTEVTKYIPATTTPTFLEKVATTPIRSYAKIVRSEIQGSLKHDVSTSTTKSTSSTPTIESQSGLRAWMKKFFSRL